MLTGTGCMLQLLFFSIFFFDVQERESALAGILRAKLQPFVDGNETQFREKALEDAHELALLPCGTAMLHAIGWATFLIGDLNCNQK